MALPYSATFRSTSRPVRASCSARTPAFIRATRLDLANTWSWRGGVQLGMAPAAATSRPAQLMGLSDLGSLAAGKRASFIVLDANPLENIRNTRRIVDVYLDGMRFDRE